MKWNESSGEYLCAGQDVDVEVVVDVELKLSSQLTLNIGGVTDIAAGIVVRQLTEVDPVPTNYPLSIGNQFDCCARRLHF